MNVRKEYIKILISNLVINGVVNPYDNTEDVSIPYVQNLMVNIEQIHNSEEYFIKLNFSIFQEQYGREYHSIKNVGIYKDTTKEDMLRMERECHISRHTIGLLQGICKDINKQ